MTQFHAGQDVEVHETPAGLNESHGSWRKAKIVRESLGAIGIKAGHEPVAIANAYHVQFPDGSCGVFDAVHIRAVTRIIEVPGGTIQQHDWYQE
jgi:hypothetical protein